LAKLYDSNKSEPGRGIKGRQGRLIGALLIVGAALHAFKPAWLTLDWPSITLILVGVFLLFVPLDEIGTVIESLEFGKTKILFRKVEKLDRSVKDAEMQEGITDAPVPRDSPEGRIENRIQALLSTDKEMALIKIGIEIERVLSELYESEGQTIMRPGLVWRQAVDFLEEKGAISFATSTACLQFRDIRNQLIHPSGADVPEELVTSAVDSGLKLLRILSKALRDPDFSRR
jgi:hypothetical protein